MSTAFRLFDPFQVFTDQHGMLASGGSLNFFVTGTTTPKDVFSDPALTVNLGNSVAIGSDGRPVSDIWGSDSYRARLLDSHSVQIGPDRDNIAIPGGGAAALPTPFIPNALLSNDGSLALWLTTILMPDPTGHANGILGTDGTAVFWQTLASLNIPTIGSGSASITLAGKKILWGTGTLPASGSNTANVACVFPDSGFSGAPHHVEAFSQAGSGVTSSGGMPILSAINRTATGFTCWGDTNAGFSPGSHLINATTPFTYWAIGPA